MNLTLLIIGVSLFGLTFNSDSIIHWMGTIGGAIIGLTVIVENLIKLIKKLKTLKDYIKKLFKKDVG